jgi:hypothetical protein
MKAPKVKKLPLRFKYFTYFFAIILFFTSCSEPQGGLSCKISKEERVWMAQFFNDFLLSNQAIFTLWGAKPITEVILYHYTDEEKQAYYDSMTAEEKKKCFTIEGYSLEETWQKWERVSSRFPMKRYMLFKSEIFQDQKASLVYFVNILQTAVVIQENYEAFRKVVNFDFNPLEVVLQMKDKNSIFWNAMKNGLGSTSTLWGLLFGFGKINSYAYQWKYFDHTESCEEFCNQLTTRLSNASLHGKVVCSIDDFQIPYFISFDESDEIVRSYKEERKRIQAIYKGRDFLNVTLERLTS